MCSPEARHFQSETRLAHPDRPEDEVVISGMSGSFPNSRNVVEYGENIRKKINLCDDDERRFKHTHSNIPKVSGKMIDISSFDAGFFGINEFQANAKDPMQRLLLELTHSAILDAGISPEELAGTKTAVYVGSCGFEAQMHYIHRHSIKGNQTVLGFSRSMLAQNISYFYKLQGPSFSLDSACSSGLYSLNEAYMAIRNGKCDRAIVAGTTALFNSKYTLQFVHLGVLNSNGECRPFDNDATGYTRAESTCVIILEKSKDAKRVYATIVHSKTNSDGFKPEGISFPSKEIQKNLVKEICTESRVTVDKIGFFEAHGTGTKIGDLEELIGIDNVFNTAERKGKPLLIGSVKANIGHTEAVASISSIIKVLYGMENNLILPNIHYKTPKRGAEGLIAGRLKVVTEETKWPADAPYSGINSFGFGGANGHVLLKRNENTQKRQNDQIPRLVCFSGRTKESILKIQLFLMNNKINNDHISLLHSSYGKNIANNSYRGYSVLSNEEKCRHSSRFSFEKPKSIGLFIDYVNNASTCFYNNIFREFKQLPIFKMTMGRFTDILENNNININLFTPDMTPLEEDMSNMCMLLGIVDILSTLQVFPTYVTGQYFGNFIAAYAVQALTFEEVVICIYKLRNLLNGINFPTDIEIMDLLKGIIKDLPKEQQRYITRDTNPYKFATLKYFVYSFTKSQTRKNSNCIELQLDGADITPIQLLSPNIKFEEFLENLGSLYEMGFELNLLKLYPKCAWPVPRGTPMISPLIKWEHNKTYMVPTIESFNHPYRGRKRFIQYNIKNHSDSYMKGHVVDGRNLFPATGYIMCVVEILANLCKNTSIDQMIFQLTNIKFHKATLFGSSGIISLHVSVEKNGKFNVTENEASVVSGHIRVLPRKDEFEIPEYKEGNFKMERKDIYKELRLRGYNYSGQFCGIQELCGNRAILDWSDNFVAFLDNILQIYVFQKNNRSLYVPTSIEKITLNFPAHKKHVKNLKNGQGVAVYLERNSNILKTESIEIFGIQATTIAKKKQLIDPILESYQFIPNEATLSLEDALRVNTQIILENTSQKTYRVLENITKKREPFAPFIEKTLNGHPLILHDIKIISELNVWFGEIKVVNEPISTQRNNIIFIGQDLLTEPKELQMALETIIEDGFIISLESTFITLPSNLIALTKFVVPTGFLYLLIKCNILMQTLPEVHILRNDYKWLNSLKRKLDYKTDIIIYSENDDYSGIVGFTNCIRRETKTKIHSFFLTGAPPFDQNKEFYKDQLKKRLVINVYKNEKWGTYRHMLLNSPKTVVTEHCFANALQIGEMNTLKWIAGPLKKTTNGVIDIHFSSINFKDLMTASGKVPLTLFAQEQQCIVGFEFSGIHQSGERVMGIVNSGAIASLVKCDPEWTWKIPSTWSLEEAATVPIAYATVLSSLKMRANIKRDESILIHSGAGAIGLSAINVALHFGLIVYTTVGNKAKRDYLIKTYPQLNPLNIGNSRDTSFEEMIFKRTKGRGVNYVLNSLAEDKLIASVRCLAKNGTFLEIGQFDLYKNSDLSAEFQNSGKSYMGIMLDRIIDPCCKRKIKNIVQHGIDAGFIKPLPRRCFKMDELQEVFRYIGAGKHIGKVMIKIKNTEDIKLSKKQIFYAMPRVYFNPNASYIVIGGLGGVGLELLDWMLIRGAKNFILCSRNGLKTGYQNFVVCKLKTCGACVKLLPNDTKTLDGCLNIIEEANKIAPVEGIFNLAAELRDGIFYNLTETDFDISLNPKAVTSFLFDKISRTYCPNLKHFVLFSSFSCGRGNAGQTNYGMANSIMERICEKRKSEGLPGLAIQWGAIADVGLVADMQRNRNETVIGGSLQQRITSCLNVLDQLLLSEEAVVASMVLAEKTDTPKSDNILDAVLNVIGIRDKKTVSPHTILPELGMDSMMAVEIKNILERDFDTFLNSSDIKILTVDKLMNMHKSSHVVKTSTNIDTFIFYTQNLFNEKTYKLLQIDLIEDVKEPKVFFFPGIEGVSEILNNLIIGTSKNSICIQYIKYDLNNITQYADEFLPIVQTIQKSNKTFYFVTHSIGTIFALELAAKLESLGYFGKIAIIDGSPDLIKEFTSSYKFRSNTDAEKNLLASIFNIFFPSRVFNIQKNSNFENLLKTTMECIPANIKCNKEMIFEISMYVYKTANMIQNYNPNIIPLKSQIIIFTPTIKIFKYFPDDLYLSKYCSNIRGIHKYVGNHTSLIDNPQVHEKIKEFFK